MGSVSVFTLAISLLIGCGTPPASPTSFIEAAETPTVTPVPVPPVQADNDQPLTELVLAPSDSLPDNHIGVHTEGYDRYSDTNHVYDTGFRRVRIQSLTEFWADDGWLLTFRLDSIPPEVDEVISDYAEHDIGIVLDLWMGADLAPYGTTFQSQEEIDTYLDYIRFVVPQFTGRIGYYQIWNEPGDIAVSDYAELVRQAVPVIREADPNARIIIGGTQGDWENGYPGYGQYQRFSVALAYLDALLRSGVVQMVDGISWHPFYDNIPTDPYYQGYPQMVQGIKTLAESQGFEGEYFADELLWRTVTEEGWDGGPPVSTSIAAKYYVRAIVMHRGLDLNVTINSFFQQSDMDAIRRICHLMGGAEPVDLPVSVTGDADNVVIYAFSLPGGDRLVAVWSNGDAVEDDPGVPADLTISGASASQVVGIDVVRGLEQELVSETEGGDLIVRDLLVKDYPVILRLTD